MNKYQVGAETARMIALRHPWVLADRFTRKWSGAKTGELALLCDEQHKPLATALLDPADRVVARILGPPGTKPDAGWFRNRLKKAQQLRLQAGLEETDAYRLVNAEGDGLPGLTIDCYAGFLMVQLYTPAWDSYLPVLLEVLKEIFSPLGIYRKLRPQETHQLEAKGGGKEYSRLLYGQAAPVPLQIKEHGLLYHADLRAGLNTGIFPDQRRHRFDLMQRVKGKRFLNLFAFTGAFSVAAAAAGARQVTSIDVSARYLDIARDNFSLNRLNPKRHRFIVGDVFAELSRLQQKGERFDIILFDPPSFSTTKKSQFSTRGGTAQLVSATLPLLEPGGLLISSSNHQKVDMTAYVKELRRGALESGCELRTIYRSGQPEDFPVPVSFPEGNYLKYVISVRD
ncbi:MAG: class I SAM-dependent rRNA methyltransferase [Geopsychrobacter sp.]|nr:class I SAM-dependent rRNA methyltransferase [Geopsychrobacter sp.]